MKPRHSQEVKAAAAKRFAEMAMPLAVSKELKIPYMTAYFWWRKAVGKPITRKAKLRLTRATKALPYDDPILMAEINNADPGDECVCDETSSRNCPEHQNGGGC